MWLTPWAGERCQEAGRCPGVERRPHTGCLLTSSWVVPAGTPIVVRVCELEGGVVGGVKRELGGKGRTDEEGETKKREEEEGEESWEGGQRRVWQRVVS